MKKLIFIALLAIMLIGMLSFAACKPKDKTDDAATDTLATETTTTTETPVVMTKEDSIKAGLLDKDGKALPVKVEEKK